MIRYLLKQSWFFIFQIKMKNEKRNLSLNFNVRLVWKSKNQLVLYFMSQFQYRNENQNSISNRILICQKNYLSHNFFLYTDYLPPFTRKVFVTSKFFLWTKHLVLAKYLISVSSVNSQPIVFSSQHVYLKTDIIWYLKSRTCLYIYLLSIVGFSKQL